MPKKNKTQKKLPVLSVKKPSAVPKMKDTNPHSPANYAKSMQGAYNKAKKGNRLGIGFGK